ncbi:RGS domain-containing protein [Chlamydoabsidia padenii]|nr:RGS domain-containing protein [Chlamydoabsidia padenii]
MDSQQQLPSTMTVPQTLEQLLSDTDSDLFQDYQQFLEQSYCCENLYFWLDVQEYNELCEQVSPFNNDFMFMQQKATTHLNPSQQILFNVVRQKCHAMIDTYIRPNANQEINIPCDLRQDLLHQVFTLGNYHPSVFTKITKSVVELMRVNAFIPWITSLTTPPVSFVGWYSFNHKKELDKGGSMDSLDQHTHLSPPPSPTTPTRYRSMLQRVRHSFMPPSATTLLKPSSLLVKKEQQQ